MDQTLTAKMVIRTAGAPGVLIPSVRSAIHSIDPRVRVSITPVSERLQRQLEEPRTLASLAAYTAVHKALAHDADETPKERALIQALAVRYAADPPKDRSALDQAYARAMAEVARRFPDDPEAATLYAESLMDLNPWDY